MEELDLVALRNDLPTLGLVAGDVGTIVFVYQNDAAFEVEFMNAVGKTIGVETLEAHQIIKVSGNQAILHVNLQKVA